MEWLTDLLNGDFNAWHWGSLVIILLILEIMGTAGFLIGTAIAALLMVVISAIAPGLDWKWQLAIFATAAILFSIIYMKRFANFNEETDEPTLNKRAAQHIGKKTVLLEATANGMSKVQIGDTRWKVQCDTELDAGTEVNITGAEGMTLIVSK